jgi:hypothetical protein
VVQAARPRFPGHQQPKVPLWGYEDESLPEVMAKKIAAAADHGIDAFLFDWYWNDQGPFLQDALERGLFGAPNNQRLRFGIMWANHQPVTRQTFEQAVDHVIATYFTHPSYWSVGGKPYFSIYEMHTLIAGLGGVEQTRSALNYLRDQTRAAGLPGVHLNAVEWGLQSLPEEFRADRNAFVESMGIDSVTSYVWIHNNVTPAFPVSDYAEVAHRAYDFWRRFGTEFKVPYHPNVTMGWDCWPRAAANTPLEPGDYPRLPVITGGSPARFCEALEAAMQFLAAREPSQRVITINAWNEWTEGSYLEPDTVNGMGYLEAIRDVFGA